MKKVTNVVSVGIGLGNIFKKNLKGKRKKIIDFFDSFLYFIKK